MRIVIVGAGLAGLRTAEELRRAEFGGEIVLIGDEPHLPYDRPPLSKDVVRGERDDTTLKPREFYADKNIDLRIGTPATAVDTAAQTVTLAGGATVSYDELVVATGLRPRRLPGLPELAGIHVLRTIADSRALRDDVAPGKRVLVVGAGFIGCEIAASFRALGVDVIVVEPQQAPLAGVLGARVGALVARMHSDEGVDIRCGAGVSAVHGTDRVTAVTLVDGTELPVDVVVLGIGAVPVTEWLDGSGVPLADGVVCDGVGRTAVPHVWAVGDVAAWAPRRRVEHWSNAGDQAKVIAKALVGAEIPTTAQVPYFWSDQYDVKIQALGSPSAADDLHVVEDDGRRFLAYYSRDGIFTGVVGAGVPAKVMKLRASLAKPTAIAAVLNPPGV